MAMGNPGWPPGTMGNIAMTIGRLTLLAQQQTRLSFQLQQETKLLTELTEANKKMCHHITALTEQVAAHNHVNQRMIPLVLDLALTVMDTNDDADTEIKAPPAPSGANEAPTAVNSSTASTLPLCAKGPNATSIHHRRARETLEAAIKAGPVIRTPGETDPPPKNKKHHRQSPAAGLENKKAEESMLANSRLDIHHEITNNLEKPLCQHDQKIWETACLAPAALLSLRLIEPDYPRQQ